MIVDSSALLAILLNESDAELYEARLAESLDSKISAANTLEVSIVLTHKKGEAALLDLDDLLRVANITTVPVSEQHYLVARRAYLQFGKGRHPACLNYGDCFSYALAKEAGKPLLYKGDDFLQTDIVSVLS